MYGAGLAFEDLGTHTQNSLLSIIANYIAFLNCTAISMVFFATFFVALLGSSLRLEVFEWFFTSAQQYKVPTFQSLGQ